MTWTSHKAELDSATLMQRLNDGIRENPVGAALVGVGIAWMLLGTSGMTAAVRAPATAVRRAPRLVWNAAETVGDQAAHAVSGVGRAAGSALSAVGDVAGRVAGTAGAAARSAAQAIGTTAQSSAAAAGETLSRVGSSVADTASRVGSGVADTAQRAVSTARHAVSAGQEQGGAVAHRLEDAGEHVQETAQAAVVELSGLHRQLGRRIEANPLLLGGIGIAIGAGLAMLFPRTPLETRLMGEAADDVRSRLDEVAHVAAVQAETTVQDLKAEMGQIGTAVRQAADEAAQKAKSVADAGRDAVANRFG